MRIGIGFMLVASLFACSKEPAKRVTRNNLLASEIAVPTEATPTPVPPVFVKELITQTSLGKTKLEIYQGEKGLSPVMGQVGALTAHSETITYSMNVTGEYSGEKEAAPDERSFPVYWIEIKPNEVAMAVFVDESLAEDLSHPHRDLRKFEVQPPGVEYCSEFRFKGLEHLSETGRKKAESLMSGMFPAKMDWAVSCRYLPEVKETECSSYYIPALPVQLPFSFENRKWIEQEKKAYSCHTSNAWYPPKKQYTETWDLKSLVVNLEPDGKTIELREDHSPLIPGGNQTKSISFSETEVEFKL